MRWMLPLVIAGCGGGGGDGFFGDASVDFTGVSGGAQVEPGTLTWDTVLAFGFTDLEGEPIETGLIGTDDVDPCGLTLDVRFDGGPTTATFPLEGEIFTFVAIAAGGVSDCPDIDRRWHATSGDLVVEASDGNITVSFTNLPMAPHTIPGSETNEAAGSFTISGTATAADFR